MERVCGVSCMFPCRVVSYEIHNKYNIYNFINTTAYVHWLIFCLGEPGSVVFGSLHDGVFEGKIMSKYDNYFVEKASRYFPNNANASFHTIIYKESDVEDPYVHRRSGIVYFLLNKSGINHVKE